MSATTMIDLATCQPSRYRRRAVRSRLARRVALSSTWGRSACPGWKGCKMSTNSTPHDVDMNSSTAFLLPSKQHGPRGDPWFAQPLGLPLSRSLCDSSSPAITTLPVKPLQASDRAMELLHLAVSLRLAESRHLTPPFRRSQKIYACVRVPEISETLLQIPSRWADLGQLGS